MCLGPALRAGLNDAVSLLLSELVHEAVVAIACDLPSGVESDSGAMLNPLHEYDLTVTFGALKPAHRLHPAMHKCGPRGAGRHRDRGVRPSGTR